MKQSHLKLKLNFDQGISLSCPCSIPWVSPEKVLSIFKPLSVMGSVQRCFRSMIMHNFLKWPIFAFWFLNETAKWNTLKKKSELNHSWMAAIVIRISLASQDFRRIWMLVLEHVLRNKKHHIFPIELSVQQERHTWEELYGILTQTVPRAQFVWTPSLYKVRDTNF